MMLIVVIVIVITIIVTLHSYCQFNHYLTMLFDAHSWLIIRDQKEQYEQYCTSFPKRNQPSYNLGP